jgi:hypothetical protein
VNRPSDRYAVRYANFVPVVTRMAVLGAQSAPKGTGESARAPRGYQGRSPWLVLITVALTLLAAVLDAKEPSLKTVLARASGYVERFERDLAGIVAEEHYMQDVEALDALPSQPPAPLLDASHRELRSDLLLVRTGGSDLLLAPAMSCASAGRARESPGVAFASDGGGTPWLDKPSKKLM